MDVMVLLRSTVISASATWPKGWPSTVSSAAIGWRTQAAVGVICRSVLTSARGAAERVAEEPVPALRAYQLHGQIGLARRVGCVR